MAVPRAPLSVRGQRAPTQAPRRESREPVRDQPEDVADPARPRQVIDYALQRRATLGRSLLAAAGASEHRDPHPDLARAARFHGETAAEPCPACRTGGVLVLLRYVYGDQLGYLTGRLRTASELNEMAFQFGRFRVYEVEVCRSCGWNHLRLSYVLGDGVVRPRPVTPRDAVTDA